MMDDYTEKILKECRYLTPIQARIILRLAEPGMGQGKHLSCQNDRQALHLYLADCLSVEKVATPEGIYAILDAFTEFIDKTASALKIDPAEIPVHRLGIIDQRYVTYTGASWALDLQTGTQGPVPKRELKIITYNVTEIFIRRVLAEKSMRDHNSEQPVKITSTPESF